MVAGLLVVRGITAYVFGTEGPVHLSLPLEGTSVLFIDWLGVRTRGWLLVPVQMGHRRCEFEFVFVVRTVLTLSAI